MRVILTVAEMQATCRAFLRKGKRIGLVPTMGALHEGHLSLVRSARAQNDVVAVSIFVNPLQFGPNEDFSKYPRTFEEDSRKLEQEGVDLLFAPAPEQMYPPGAATYVCVEGLSEKLDGKSRPGHFRGVTTIVSKLFHIVQADCAYFGQKDAAQVAVLRKMARDQNIDIQIVVCPIVREPDGLALSSRNTYLSTEERRQALVLHRALTAAESLWEKGEKNPAALRGTALQLIAAEPGARLDYLEIVDPDTLDPVQDLSQGALIAVAAWFGATRLIDNVLLGHPGQKSSL